MPNKIKHQLRRESTANNSGKINDKSIPDKVFQLKYDRLLIGELGYDNKKWTFTYAEDFKKVQHKYNHIAGFSNMDKVYQSDELWPFFQSRIPGLKQPAVKEILIKEHIDANNKFELLKRFGKESIHNPYELELV